MHPLGQSVWSCSCTCFTSCSTPLQPLQHTPLSSQASHIFSLAPTAPMPDGTLANPPKLWHCHGMCMHAGAAATITGAATSAASVGIVTTSSGAAGAAYYSSKMAKRAADISEFGFVRLAEYQARRAAAESGAEAPVDAAAGLEQDRRGDGGAAPGPALPHEGSPGGSSTARRMKVGMSSGWGWGKASLRASRSRRRDAPAGGGTSGPEGSAGMTTAGRFPVQVRPGTALWVGGVGRLCAHVPCPCVPPTCVLLGGGSCVVSVAAVPGHGHSRQRHRLPPACFDVA